MKMQIVIITSLIVFLTSLSLNAATTFSDNFDNSEHTLNSWSIASGIWEFVLLDGTDDYGYQCTYSAPNDDAVAYIEDTSLFPSMFGLSASVEVSPIHVQVGDETEGSGIYFGNQDGTGVEAALIYDYSDGWYHSAGEAGEDATRIPINVINFDQFYYLDFSIDMNGNFTSNLRDSSGTPISSIPYTVDFVIDSPILAIASDGSATFNNFNATHVPVPPAMLLLGSGLIGLISIRNRNQAA